MEIQISNLSNRTITPIDDDDCLPDWLLFEILLRLPIKSVFKCRVISKRWLSVASAPYFIRAYAARASSSWIVLPPLVFWDEKFLPTFVHNPSNNPVLGELYLQPPPPRSILRLGEIIGVSDDGLVFYCTYTGALKFDLYVCNPITGDRTEPVELPLARHKHLGWGFLTRLDGEFTIKSYRVVQAMAKLNDSTMIIFYVYYSETGEWKEFTVDERPLALQKSAAVLDGILYWADTSGGGVIAYDPEAEPEQVRLIRDPHGGERPSAASYSCRCDAYRGELRYFGGYCRRYNGIPSFSIWRLEGGSGEWCLVHKIEKESIMDIGTDICLEIVCFDPFNSDVVYLLDGRFYQLFSYDMKSGALDDRRELIVDDNGPRSLLKSGSEKAHVLVVPPWPTHFTVQHGGWF